MGTVAREITGFANGTFAVSSRSSPLNSVSPALVVRRDASGPRELFYPPEQGQIDPPRCAAWGQPPNDTTKYRSICFSRAPGALNDLVYSMYDYEPSLNSEGTWSTWAAL